MSKVVTRRGFLKATGLMSGAVVLAACGGGGGGSAAPAEKQAVALSIEPKGEELKYAVEKLEAPANSKITLTLKNVSSANKHNWVLTKPGQADAVAAEGIGAGEAANYIKDGPNIIAHTKLVNPGASDSVTFDAPAAGDYPFVCTFPGHNVLMKGVLTIK